VIVFDKTSVSEPFSVKVTLPLARAEQVPFVLSKLRLPVILMPLSALTTASTFADAWKGAPGKPLGSCRCAEAELIATLAGGEKLVSGGLLLFEPTMVAVAVA
jgi:hypothetical protein